LYRGYTGATGRYSRYISGFGLEIAPTPAQTGHDLRPSATQPFQYEMFTLSAALSSHGTSLQADLQKRLLMKIYSTENSEEPLGL
jgi:hypothetical protein